ncbi:hypothetical protein KJ596_03805 [Patescibacteria group bacterium]|nr:hypothetical protein [Patescibacteria group bacterium]MBU1868400.1 hypothetical protein [Patescibacteria group bacterium]
MQNHTAYRLATLISRISGIATLTPLAIVTLFFQRDLNLDCKGVYLALFLIIGWLVPCVYFAIALYCGWVKDIDATNRRERYVPYAVSFACWSALLVIAVTSLTAEFLDYFFPIYLLQGAMFLITFKYKISVHAALNTVFYLLLNQAASWRFWFLFPVVIIVCWSRWLLKKHTIGQLILGVAVVAIIWFAHSLIL